MAALWTDSTFVLAGFNYSLLWDETRALCHGDVGLAAHLARIRATQSRWSPDAATYCEGLAAEYPPASEGYTVQPGDTLSGIVRRRYELPFQNLWPLVEVLNPEIRDPNVIRAGQVVRLPKLPEMRAGGSTHN
jgi:hypothetical protein